MKALTKLVVALIALIGVSVVNAAPAQAKLFFGTKEYLTMLQDINVKGPNGESLYLAHKYAFHAFLLPYRVSDDGYVLGIRGQSQSYFRLDPARIKALQSQGVLPTPMPPYRLGAIEYILGYSLWLALFVIGLLGLNQATSRSRTATA